METMKERIVLITGSTDGIGKETARQLAQKGAVVLLHGRNATRGRQVRDELIRATGNEQIDYFNADFSALDEVRALAGEIRKRYRKLHVLINNAGIFESKRRLSKDGFELTFAVNHLAHFLLTCLLKELLWQGAPARVINVSSMAHSHELDFENLQGEKSYSGYTAYAYSKLCNILFTFKLAKLWKDKKITVNCLHPGVISTKLLHAGWGMGGASPQQGARTSVYLASSPEVKDTTGTYFFDMQGPAKPAAIAYDTAVQDRLWELSEQWTGCKFE
jgi:NAD(P)-dependent dehydrogenase (short-subunit alcohol dehydrogenase family)